MGLGRPKITEAGHHPGCYKSPKYVKPYSLSSLSAAQTQVVKLLQTLTQGARRGASRRRLQYEGFVSETILFMVLRFVGSLWLNIFYNLRSSTLQIPPLDARRSSRSMTTRNCNLLLLLQFLIFVFVALIGVVVRCFYSLC